MKKKQPTRVNYYEDPITAEYINNLPFHTQSIWIREATLSKMGKEKKGLMKALNELPKLIGRELRDRDLSK